MKVKTNILRIDDRLSCKSVTKHLVILFICLVFLILASGTIGAQTEWPHVVFSKDGTPISYEISGSGEPTLIFVHGLSCDARYWRAQVPHFSKKHRVIILDLAGHGHSGTARTRYTMGAFGEDVRALEKAIHMLLGKSDKKTSRTN
jgi:predicted alpha/beta-fold hydrolase